MAKLIALSALPPVLGMFFLLQNGHPIASVLILAIAMWVFLAPFLYLTFWEGSEGLLTRMATDRYAILGALAALLLTYLIVQILMGVFSPVAAAKLSAYLFLPLVAMMWLRRSEPAPQLGDAILLIAVWLVFELDLLKDLWQGPIPDANAMTPMLAVVAAILVFSGSGRYKNVGLPLRLPSTQWKMAATWLLFCVVIIIPLGLALGFLEYNGNLSPLKMLGASVGILFFIAIPEELLFRGFMQNLLYQKTQNTVLAIACSSIFFGLIHLNNFGFPNYSYAILALVVGVACSYTYHITSNLAIPVLIHTVIDAAWVGYFMK